MFWAALASLIMALTGSGDDTAAYRHYLEELREGIGEVVADPERRAEAVSLLDDWFETFRAYREGLQGPAQCLDATDRRYDATREDYYQCFEGLDAHWEASVERLLTDRRTFDALLTDAEMQALRKRASP